MPYKVKEVSEIAGVSVRTLHHYDEIGLLTPGAVNSAGYRFYTEREMERLQQILFFREIGFSLNEIKAILDSPGFDRKSALEAHRELLLEKKRRLDGMIDTVTRTIQSIEGGSAMSDKELFEGFDMTPIEEHKKKYAAEARQTYGDATMDAIEKRTNAYTKEDWARITARNEAINAKIIAAMERGPADPEVQEGVGELRQYITEHFYDCTLEIFRGLGDLYVTDGRFTANLDKNKPGYAAFLQKAMHVYCDREEREGEPG
ncbi:MerR family transcriptional regulator [Paenibacillus validus]|uniref:MerR family transcriptional regulator n=1 Tax=Paenibacillus validus TaxID=44253 RepID=UPI000FDA3980|nr:MerR family transcriptional regulator [Paenibacillus validus]MED4604239.1 MerR family transcriptional regulator [Paenibacillus validus]MED4609512.1 MerR family transcriptional regulator [Paenibacillus validus]